MTIANEKRVVRDRPPVLRVQMDQHLYFELEPEEFRDLIAHLAKLAELVARRAPLRAWDVHL